MIDERNLCPDRRGLIIVFTGDGKGKTTAAVGTAVRALGHGLKVYLAFFLKGDDFAHGEIEALSSLSGATVITSGQKGWVNQSNVTPELKKQVTKTFSAASSAVLSGEYDLVVLDEINVAIELGLVSEEELLSLMKKKPCRTNVILTGRHACPGVVEIADLVTELVSIKHPFYNGIGARKGIEY